MIFTAPSEVLVNPNRGLQICRKVSLLLILFLVSTSAFSQFLLENPAGNINTRPIARDVNVCFPQDAPNNSK